MQQLNYATEGARWDAVLRRDQQADPQFFFAVTSTGVYCYPSCAARRPHRRNVRFFARRAAAEAQGFRPCARCRADLAPPEQRRTAAVVAACRALQADAGLSLQALAREAGLSPTYFQRLFKQRTGLTPKQFAKGLRAARLRRELQEGSGTVTDAIFAAGYGSNSRLYERTNEVLGMSPQHFAKGGMHCIVRFALAECWLGNVLIAATEAGVCGIFFGDQSDALVAELRERFPRAELLDASTEPQFSAWVAIALAYVEAPAGEFPLPLDLAGTVFQQRVWRALLDIPPGSTTSYAKLAARIGKPTATRAVAGACGANPVAVAVPCHRVVRSDGKVSGYRWGVARKRALLAREAGQAGTQE